jgi:hypothetical protein
MRDAVETTGAKYPVPLVGGGIEDLAATLTKFDGG